MTINNSRNIIGYKLRQLFVTILFITLFAVLYATSLIKTPFLGLSRPEIGIALLVIYVLFMVYHFSIDLNYILYSDEGFKIVLRYYSIKIYANRHHSVEIHKKDFHRYEIRHSLLGLKPQLILYLKMKKGTGRYPPISIASLNHRQKKELKASLDKYVKSS